MPGIKPLAASVAAALIFGSAARYCWLVLRGEIQPAVATWLLFCVAVSLSFWTYWSHEKRSVVSNVGNAADVVGVWAILACIVCAGRDVRFWSNAVDVGCLAASTVILVYWRLSKRYVQANLALQAVMTVAYLPTFHKLWHATQSTESLGVWSVYVIAAIVGLVPPILSRDMMAIVYSTRAFVMVSAVILLILRIS